jgi:hypothetical protein
MSRGNTLEPSKKHTLGFAINIPRLTGSTRDAARHALAIWCAWRENVPIVQVVAKANDVVVFPEYAQFESLIFLAKLNHTLVHQHTGYAC